MLGRLLRRCCRTILFPVYLNHDKIDQIHMNKKLSPEILLALALAIAGCTATAPIVRNNDGTYLIQQEGEWSYHDLEDAKQSVMRQARDFATKQGKTVEIVKEEVTPQNPMGVYPSFDGEYRLTFRLRDSGAK